ncbi:recombinase family protein [Priestia megaterium]|uniref:recombinase family protein n=1 Tax=Priestia megaterium TaxID=1404 RepID=UPI0015CF5FCC|nr:recombinase family protein [Priestia megaterium]
MKTTLIKNVAAIYIRVSTEKTSQKDSPEHQRGICEERALEEKLDIQHIYEDRSSGTSIYGREDMKKLMKDAEEGFFDTIIFASLSRFARNLNDALNLREYFVNALGIRLIAIDENYDSKVDDNPFKFELHGMMNENLSKTISLAAKRGIRQSAKRGNFTGAHAPFGYKKINDGKNKTLEVIEKDASVVKEIFEMYVNRGMGEKQIINQLNEEDIPSPKGGIWGITTVQRILKNEAYCGFNVYRKYQVKTVYDDLNDLQNRKKKLVERDKVEWERNEERNWEPIIEDELFQNAQEVRKERGGGRRGGIRNVKVNPFAGILKCAHCGSNYVSMKSGKTGKNGQEYRYLICSSRRRMGVKGCKNRLWVPLNQFKSQLLQQITDSLHSKINVEEVASSYEIPKKKEVSFEKKIKQHERSIDLNRSALADLRKDLVSGGIDAEQFNYEKQRFLDEISNLQEKLNNLKKNQMKETNDELVRTQIKLALDKLVKLDFSNTEELQYTLKQVIEEVKIDENGEVDIYTKH